MVSLRLVPVSGNPIEVTQDSSLVGRDPSCDVVVTDGSVSRRHARLERRSGEWWVVDQGSANGTFLNSLKVAETALKNGQELRFGALAFRVEVSGDPDATVATPVLPEETVMATPRPAPPPPLPEPRAPSAVPPVPRSAPPPPPPPPPGATAPGDRFRTAGSAPVPQMSGGAPPAKKGRGPVFWVAGGCCGCLLLGLLLVGLLGGWAYVMGKGAADTAHAWLADAREGRMGEVTEKLSDRYRSRLSQADLEEIVSTVQQSVDATFPGRNVENNRVMLTGVLTGPSGNRPIAMRLVRQGGQWKVDDVTFRGRFRTFEE